MQPHDMHMSGQSIPIAMTTANIQMSGMRQIAAGPGLGALMSVQPQHSQLVSRTLGPNSYLQLTQHVQPVAMVQDQSTGSYHGQPIATLPSAGPYLQLPPAPSDQGGHHRYGQ
jgi:hypothetical protein